MKRSETAIVILAGIISVLVAYFLGRAFLGNVNEEVTTIKHMAGITSNLTEPNSEYFNAYMHNPTVEIYIGECPVGQVWDETNLTCIDENLIELEDEEVIIEEEILE